MALKAIDLRVLKHIPVQDDDGLDTVGLRELFTRAHKISDLAVGLPPAAAGLRRILTVMAARITGLDTPGKASRWFARRNDVFAQGHFDLERVEDYFDEYSERFFLFHPERPFLQDPRLSQDCSAPSGLNKLVFGRPSGNNQPWMSHHHDKLPVPVPVEDAVLHLVAQLYYGAPGRCTTRTVEGRSEANMTSGPARGLVSYHPTGTNLFESLVAGIPAPVGSGGSGVAVWEAETLHDPLSVPPEGGDVGWRLAGRFRHGILLVPSEDKTAVIDAYSTWAWRHPHPPMKDPFAIYQTSKKGEQYARPADASRALWRDLDGLLLHNVGIEHRQQPQVFEGAMHFDVTVLSRLRVQAFGFDQDRSQVNDRQWYSASTPPVLGLLDDVEAAAQVSRIREAAEQAAWRMTTALRNAWVAVNSPGNDGPDTTKVPDGPWPELAAARYWPAAEREFWAQASQATVTSSVRPFVRLALDAFDAVTDNAGPALEFVVQSK
ncbi:type I-E CRISPR-associated protein Cse1/CasA [Nocardia sp. CNY236]|uniref:type I-E CRISPR-associated protein Cse1/CasA n=1 Tax=Nocardia sp. CNY236 TaxID=1169152 RepID=UPI000412C70F|nr:type I-E CRISPR-associated protein Cse1/CasA [Nocardia sp. CNY236]